MKKKIKGNIFLIIFLVLFLIPKTRMFMQSQVQKIIGYFNQPSIGETIDTIEYYGGLKGFNAPNIDVSRLKGKVVIINYWATWCPPCVAEMPSFQALYEEYKDQDEVVFLFLTNDTPEKLTAFLNRKQYTLPVYIENNTVFSNLNPTSIPTTYIANKTGEIKVKKTGAVQWNSEKVHNIIAQLLTE